MGSFLKNWVSLSKRSLYCLTSSLYFTLLILSIIFLGKYAVAQTFDTFNASKSNLEVNETVIFDIQLQSESETYGCAFELDFGDASARKKFRVHSKEDAALQVQHAYSRPGIYAAKVDGSTSLLDEGLSLKSLNSLLPAFPCTGSMAIALNVVESSADLTGCAPPADESRVVPCAEGSLGTIVQRRSYSCPGPTAQPWVTESMDCVVQSEAQASVLGDSPSALINRGWASFLGKSGEVDEFEALRLTAEGIQKAKSEPGQMKWLISIGRNNLSVFHKCGRDPRIRDHSIAQMIGLKEAGKNRYSSDNYIWNVFLGSEEVDSTTFVEFLRTKLRDHPVTGYIERNGGRLPKSRVEALEILKKAARGGDYLAAEWIGFHYECGSAAIDIPSALKWMSIAAENAEKNEAPERDRVSISDRLTRLKLLDRP